MKNNPVQNMAGDFVSSHDTKSQIAFTDSILELSRSGKNSALATASILVASFALLQSTPAQAANLITNGNFETGNFTGWTNNIPGLEGVGTADVGGNTTNIAYFAAFRQLGAISQTITTIAGQNYSLSYDFFSDGGTPNQFQVQVNGSTLFDRVNIPLSSAFTPYSFNFVGTGSDTIQFAGLNYPSAVYLDNVVVDLAASTAVPEPFTIIGTVVGGTAAIRMRKKLKSVDKG